MLLAEACEYRAECMCLIFLIPSSFEKVPVVFVYYFEDGVLL